MMHSASCSSLHDLKENWRLELFLLQLDERLENHRAGVHRLPGFVIQGKSAQRLAAALSRVQWASCGAHVEAVIS